MSNLVVHKFEIKQADEFELSLPVGCKILKFGNQDERLWIWVLLDQRAPLRTRKFLLTGTGFAINVEGNLDYIGTTSLINKTLIFHLFEV